MNKPAKQIIAEIRARRVSLESEAKALRKVEDAYVRAALKAQHRPAPPRRKRAKK